MPSAVSNQNNYYAAHHRRQSSQSQTNLHDPLVTSPTHIQSPSQSLVFLPSTAYQPPLATQQRARTPSVTSATQSSIKLELAKEESLANDPHEFYRQYQDPLSAASPSGLHQEAIRTTTNEQDEEQQYSRRTSNHDDRGVQPIKSLGASRQLSSNAQHVPWEGVNPKAPGSVPTALRSRKASFKDLVARFDASPDEIPPLPTQQISRPGSRTASPMPFATVEINYSAGAGSQPKRPSSRLSDTYRRNGSASASAGTPNAKIAVPGRSRTASSAAILSKSVTNPEVAHSGRRLLFGEVLPSASSTSAAGYGISIVQRRRGSEGSPMHSPNPMFPSGNPAPLLQQPQTSVASINLQTGQLKNQHFGLSQQVQAPLPHHRRANSDFVGTSRRDFEVGKAPLGPSRDVEDSPIFPRSAAETSSKISNQSRIPLSTRHQRIASDSAAVSPTSHPAFISQLPFRNLASSQTGTRSSPHGSKNAASPRRRPQSPIQIKSPGRRRRDVAAHGEKSPSLRANIIAPPPKISPPLRSSRPRLPVSSATTSASRAKMAEKFQSMAKQQSDMKAYRRQRPPELSDIDLKARRLKITQALSRSREGDDLRLTGLQTRGSSSSRPDSTAPSISESEPSGPHHPEHIEIPAVIVNFSGSPTDLSEERAFYTPDEQSLQERTTYTQNALKIVDAGSRQTTDEIDSPTLGHAESCFAGIPFSLNTQLLPVETEHEPSSALTEGTVATEATLIDMEPQADATRLQTPAQSLFAQISSLRSQSSDSPLTPTSQTSGDLSDRADEVSVQLMLRETTYLDDDEAAEKGYRPFLPSTASDPAPSRSNGRSSWTSSIEEMPESEDGDKTSPGQKDTTLQGDSAQLGSGSLSDSLHSGSQGDSLRDQTSRDTYTIVNLVLQQQTPSGVVDQQLVDDIYHRIIQASPDLADAEGVDEEKVQRLCLRELEDYHSQWGQGDLPYPQSPPEPYLHSDETRDQDDIIDDSAGRRASGDKPPPTLPPTSYRGHRYKSSLDSAEDWAETSPSVGDWIQFALKSPVETQHHPAPSPLAKAVVEPDQDQDVVNDTKKRVPLQPVWTTALDDSPTIGRDLSIPLPPPPPAHSPPPPPVRRMASMDQLPQSAPPGIKPSTTLPAQPARPLTALSQMSARSSLDHRGDTVGAGIERPSEEGDLSPEQRRLKQRRHVIKELVDTEYTYERDMRVLCDIYKQTAVVAVSEEDTKIIFGNVESVQHFAKDFLGLLKQVARPAYVMDKSDKRKEAHRVSTARASTISIDGTADLTEAEKDEMTKVGHAFEASLSEMEKVYTEYIRTRHPANKRLEALQTSSAVREWLKECSENSTDITNAWSLDALLVKPIQRITKYPLLLGQLVEATPATHPDYEFIRRALVEVTDINVRINDVKKHTEIVDQVLNRKRKESDVRTGLTKAFGRRAEKLRQHVGINDMHEDPEYTKIRIKYDNNIAHLFLVTKDCQGYLDAMREWVGRIVGIAEAAESWVDVGHTSHSQAESKLRQFAIMVRGVHTIALPDHIEQVTKRVIQPMDKTASMLERFTADSKGLVQKRDKRLLDYSQFRNKRDRGEKIDKKMTERMEQWEALNLEAKERMKRLLSSTADLVHACQASLIELQQDWLKLCQGKFAIAMEIDLDRLELADIMREFHGEFDSQYAYATTLSICNGTLLAEAINLLSFLTPGTTLANDDSPRQPSWNSSMKRSASTNDDFTRGSSSDHYRRYTEGPTSPNSDDRSDHTSFTYANGRMRTASAASGRVPKTPEGVPRAAAQAGTHSTNNPVTSRPGTGLDYPDDPLTRSAPRVSLEAPSPTIGALLTESPVLAKHISSSTFYSAAPGPAHAQPQLPASRGSIFSSAMPMDDNEPAEWDEPQGGESRSEPEVHFTAASVYEFNIDRARQQGGFRYLTYVTGEIFDVIAENGELWLAINQDDETREIGWIWSKHFAKLAT